MKPVLILAVLATSQLSEAATVIHRLSIAPLSFELSGSRARQQLLVTGHFENRHEEIDLTRHVRYESRSPDIAVVTSDGLILPR